MERQKRPQIAFGDPDDSADPVHGEVTAFDPSADRPGGDSEALCYVRNGEKIDLILTAVPRRGRAETRGPGLYEAARHA